MRVGESSCASPHKASVSAAVSATHTHTHTAHTEHTHTHAHVVSVRYLQGREYLLIR